MAELTVFGYLPGSSFAHQRDARTKIAALAIYSTAVLKATDTGLILLSLLAAGALPAAGISVKPLFRELRYFVFLLAGMLAARAFFTPGTPLIPAFPAGPTAEGVVSGALLCWRLLLIVVAGLVLVASTATSHIRTAVQWFLAPVPLVPEKRVAAMMGLLVRLLPLVHGQIHETLTAQRARCVHHRRNPFYRLKVLLIPLMSRLFDRADELTLAMEARAYQEPRTEPKLQSDAKDWLVLGVVAGAGLSAVLL
jgi:energy-coupling factor transporter transmembrane protein EcfT